MNKNTFISASAGTGKTYRLVEEYMGILRSDEKLGIENILAITFTEKAAAEMKERVAKAILEQIDKAASESERKRWKEINSRVMHAWISTIHSFCARILRESIEYKFRSGSWILDHYGNEEDTRTSGPWKILLAQSRFSG